jgi:integrase
VKLTPAKVESLPITGKLYDVHDAVVPELHVRVPASPNGRKVYAVRLRIRGTNQFKRVTLGPVSRMSPEEARAKAREVLNQLAKGEDPREKQAPKIEEFTMRKLFEDWYAHHAQVQLSPSTAKEAARIWTVYWEPRLGRHTVPEVRPDLVANCFAAIVKDHGPTMANRAKAWLSALFGYARRIHGYLGANPCQLVPKTKETPRQRYLAEHELGAFVRWCREHSPGPGDGLLLLLLTGVRQGSLAKGAFDQVDFKAGVWHIPAKHMKAGKPHDLPMPKQALAILETRQRLKLPWPKPSRNAWREAKQALGLGDVRLHDLRRTLAVVLGKLGCPSLTVAAILGHTAPRELAVTAVYSPADRETMAKWLQQAADYLERLVEAEGNVVPFTVER